MFEVLGFTFPFALITAFLYRLGGLSKEEAQDYLPFIPSWMVNTKARDMGVPFVTLIWMIIKYPHVAWWVHLLSFGIMFGMLTTYWDSLFGFDNYWFHGFMIGGAYFLYAFQTHLFLGYILRSVVLAVLMGAWCKIFSNDWVEELGRGFFIGITLPLMLI